MRTPRCEFVRFNVVISTLRRSEAARKAGAGEIVDDEEHSSRDHPDDGSAPKWVRWGCTALVVMASAALAIYMFAS